jgi:hypothetical protein
MNIHKKNIITLICLIALSTNAFSQNKALDSMVIINTGDYKPSIADALKLNDMPVLNDSTKKIVVTKYTISPQKINPQLDLEPIPAAQMIGEPLTKLYNGLVKAGFGNYTTPYAEAWYNYLRSKEYAYGFHLKHLSSSAWLKDHGYAGFSDNRIELYGKKFLKEHTLSGSFDYNRSVVHFYGHDRNLHTIDKDGTAQRFNFFNAQAELLSNYSKAKKYHHQVKLGYYNLADLYKASENNIKANGFVETSIQKEVLKVNAVVDFYNYKTAIDTINNTIVTINPTFTSIGEKYKATLGVTAVMDNFEKSKFYFYPVLELSYDIFDNIIIPFGGVSGGLVKNSFKSLTDENPFVLSNLEMKNTNEKYALFGGLKGTISSKIAYNAKATYTNAENIALYVTDKNDVLSNRFEVIYDNGQILNVRGEIAYQDKEKLRVLIFGDYFNYKMKTEQKAWYKPQVKIGISANYNLKEKIVAKMDLFYLDQQFAKLYDKDAIQYPVKSYSKELKGLFDANLGIEYKYNKRLGFFLNLNNIAAVRYNRWYNYPTQRFGVMAGLSFSF